MVEMSSGGRFSRGRFLAGLGGAFGAATFGSLAGAREASAHEYDGNTANTTGTYVPEGQYHLLKSDRPEVISWGFLPNRDAKPVMSVQSGDIVAIEQISHEGIQDDQGNPVKFFAGWDIPESEILPDMLMVFEEVEHKGEGPHVVTGPVYIEGAQPGDWLEVRCLDIQPRVTYGVNSARHGKGSLPGEYPLDGKAYYGNLLRFDFTRNVGLFPAGDGIEVPLQPFMGIVGVAPDTSEMVNSIPPNTYGGNLDVKRLMTAGSTAFYPVKVPGALLYTSDGHAAQGNGEVSLTAIETSQTPTFQVIVHKKERLREEYVGGRAADVEGNDRLSGSDGQPLVYPGSGRLRDRRAAEPSGDRHGAQPFRGGVGGSGFVHLRGDHVQRDGAWDHLDGDLRRTRRRHRHRGRVGYGQHWRGRLGGLHGGAREEHYQGRRLTRGVGRDREDRR
jgi:acetamidase/formamidase